MTTTTSATASTAAGAATTATSQAAADRTKLTGDMNTFLKLLVTQLKNQDPQQPLDANQFTAQLVQFSSVEQQITQNQNLEKILTAVQGNQTTQMASYLGRTVEASGAALPLQDGQAHATYALAEKAATISLTIRDATGGVVRTMTGSTAVGTHDITWDGRSDSGRQLPDGPYTVAVIAKNAGGESLEVAQTYTGRVSGVSAEGGKSSLEIGDVAVSADDVLAIREPLSTSN